VLSDFLKLAGYEMFAFTVGLSQVIGIKQFFKNPGYVTKDESDTGISRDWNLFDLYKNVVVPQLVNHSTPFVLHMLTEDTHPMYFTDPRCGPGALQSGKDYPPFI
jgi:hypothetical protein